MSARHVFTLIVVCCTISQLGCCCMRNACCGGCGMGGQVYDCCSDSCCASCGCPEASCCCPEPSCCCPSGCCDEVGCGTGVRNRCPLLARLRRALNRCYCHGCGGKAYCSEWNDCPPCDCDPCDCYGNYIGGPYRNPHGRRAQMAKRNMNISEELSIGEADGETVYR